MQRKTPTIEQIDSISAPHDERLKQASTGVSISCFGDLKWNSNEAPDIKRRGYDFVDSINQETMVFTDISFTDQWLF